GILGHAGRPETFLQLRIQFFVPKAGAAGELARFSIGVLSLVLIQELGQFRGVVVCHNSAVADLHDRWAPSLLHSAFSSPPMPESQSRTPAPPAVSPREIRMIPFIVGCALFMQMLYSTVVATALPAMALDFGTTVVH